MKQFSISYVGVLVWNSLCHDLKFSIPELILGKNLPNKFIEFP